jgi:hypothetical protein
MRLARNCPSAKIFSRPVLSTTKMKRRRAPNTLPSGAMVFEVGGTFAPLTRPTRFSPTQIGKGTTAVAGGPPTPLRSGVLRKASTNASGVQMQRVGSHFFVAVCRVCGVWVGGMECVSAMDPSAVNR